jgi:hypothetical protein
MTLREMPGATVHVVTKRLEQVLDRSQTRHVEEPAIAG